MMPRTGTLDIETFPLLVKRWKLYDETPVALNQVQEEWSIASFAWKWSDEKRVIYQDCGGRGAHKVRDDKKLVRALVELLDEADIVIGQNHKKFDLKKIHARMAMHGIKPYSPIRIVDTTIEARRYFAFTSNKLAWLSEHLTDTPKDEHKQFPGFDLWNECLLDNPKAWREMRKYNIRDVEATEKVYQALLPWMTTHPNVGVYLEDKDTRCHKCGSDKLQWNGYRYTQQGKYQRYSCNSCHGWGRGKIQHLAHNVRKNLLVGA
jgi:DNA polymerase elongation subunit (family B)